MDIDISVHQYCVGQNFGVRKQMRIVWDEPKRLANLEKHDLDFTDLTLDFLRARSSFRREIAGWPQSADWQTAPSPSSFCRWG